MIDWPAGLWVGIAAAGAVIAGIAIREALADVRSMGNRKNGRRILAISNLRSQFFLLMIEGTWVVLGLPVLLDDRETPLNPFVIGLIWTSALLAVKSYLNLRDRRRVLAAFGASK